MSDRYLCLVLREALEFDSADCPGIIFVGVLMILRPCVISRAKQSFWRLLIRVQTMTHCVRKSGALIITRSIERILRHPIGT
jgi:hypothetical protein